MKPLRLSRATQRGHGAVVSAVRCTIEKAELILGLKRRNIQAKAARGAIPGAIKLGNLWTFDVAELGNYLKMQGEQQCAARLQPDASGVVKSFGAAFTSMAGNSDGRYKQVIQKLRHNGARQHKSAR